MRTITYSIALSSLRIFSSYATWQLLHSVSSPFHTIPLLCGSYVPKPCLRYLVPHPRNPIFLLAYPAGMLNSAESGCHRLALDAPLITWSGCWHDVLVITFHLCILVGSMELGEGLAYNDISLHVWIRGITILAMVSGFDLGRS